MKPLRVLMVEDSEGDALLVIRELKNGGYEPEYERVETAEAMCAALRRTPWDVILCDYQLPRLSGLAAIDLLKETGIDIPLIIVSGTVGEETAANCMGHGACDCVMKRNLSRLVPAIERELKEAESRARQRQIEKKLNESEDKFKKTFHFSPVLAAISSIEDGRFLDANEIFLRTTLFSREEVIGKTSFELGLFADPAQRQGIRNILEEKGHARNIAVRMVAKNGQIMDGLFSAEPVTFDNEKCWLTVMVEVTEQKRMEEALRRSEENFHASLDHSPLGVRIVTMEGETLYANRAFLDIYGYESAEELGKVPIRNRYTPESYAGFKIRREERKGGVETPSEYTVDIIRKNGEVRHLQVLRKEITWDGKSQFQVIYQDITERKQAEEKLRESEERFRHLAAYHKRLNDISIAFAEAPGAEDLFNRISESFRFLTGAAASTFSVYNPETRSLKAVSLSIDPISGDKVDSIFGPDLFEMCMPVNADDMGQMLHQGIKRPKDLCELSFGVVPREISDAIMDAVGFRQILALAIIYDEELFGTCVAYLPEDKPVVPDEALKVYANLSGLAVKRRQTEEALRESEKRYRGLFENSIMGISQADPDGRLIVVNNAYAQMYGYASAEEMMAEVPDVGQLYANPEDREEVLGILKEQGVMKPREMAVVRRDGTRFVVLVGAREIRDSNGNLLYYQAEHIDISERKKVEEELRDSGLQLRALAVRLQQIREEERVLISREIHDEMGGGLTGLKMDLSWLLHRIGDADPFEARPVLMGKIHMANESIDQLIRVVRRISTDLRPSVLDDLGLIAALEWQLSEFTNRTGIQHEFATTFDDVQLEGDTAVAVFRIFQEALTNVVRHARATRVGVVLREGERGLCGNETVVLEIRDNGRGIMEKEILHPGALGLLGMKERVLAFGGELSIHGDPGGGGTAVVVQIPRKQGEPS